MSKKGKNFTISMVIILALLLTIYKAFLEDSIHIKYLKYYEGVTRYIPTDEEKEFIIVAGERGYNCEINFDADDYTFERYNELSEEITIYCSKDEYKITKRYPDPEPKEINGNYYEIESHLELFNYDGEYYITAKNEVILLKSTDNEQRRSSLTYNHIFSPFYNFIEDELVENDGYTISINGNSCIFTSSKERDILDTLLNKKKVTNNGVIKFGNIEGENADSIESEIEKCNEVIDEGYGKAIYYDVIKPIEDEMQEIIEKGNKILK